jgi:SH3-like domain-containing protein
LSNIRAAAAETSDILMRVAARAPLQITGQEGSWLRLRLRDGRTGWIHESLVALDPAVP